MSEIKKEIELSSLKWSSFSSNAIPGKQSFNCRPQSKVLPGLSGKGAEAARTAGHENNFAGEISRISHRRLESNCSPDECR
jgi:hypothetical protein